MITIALALAPAVVTRLIGLAAVFIIAAMDTAPIDTAPAVVTTNSVATVVERGGRWRRQRPPAASDPAT